MHHTPLARAGSQATEDADTRRGYAMRAVPVAGLRARFRTAVSRHQPVRPIRNAADTPTDSRAGPRNPKLGRARIVSGTRRSAPTAGRIDAPTSPPNSGIPTTSSASVGSSAQPPVHSDGATAAVRPSARPTAGASPAHVRLDRGREVRAKMVGVVRLSGRAQLALNLVHGVRELHTPEQVAQPVREVVVRL